MEIELDFKKFIEEQKKLGSINIEGDIPDYSFSGEHTAKKVLSKFGAVMTALEPMIRVQRDSMKVKYLGGGVKVTPNQFPKIYNILVHCSKELGISIPEAFVYQEEKMNAMTLGTNDDSIIVINSGMVDNMDEKELQFVIGHECGHIQNRHVTYIFLSILLASIASVFLSAIIRPFLFALDHWKRQAEITCDRAGLLCCKDIEVAKKVMLKIAAGSGKLYNEINEKEYMKQIDEIKPNIGRLQEFFLSHPYLPKRVSALELYSQSQNYLYKTTGVDNIGISKEDLDKKVSEVLKII